MIELNRLLGLKTLIRKVPLCEHSYQYSNVLLAGKVSNEYEYLLRNIRKFIHCPLDAGPLVSYISCFFYYPFMWNLFQQDFIRH